MYLLYFIVGSEISLKMIMAHNSKYLELWVMVIGEVKGRDQIQATPENLLYFTQFYNCSSDAKIINHAVS